MGILDFASMMKNIPLVMSQMKEMQERMKTARFRGSAGGGLVEVEVNGTGEALSVKIDPVAVNPSDVEMLQDLVVSAFADARAKMAREAQDQISRAAGGLDLSGLDLSALGLPGNK